MIYFALGLSVGYYLCRRVWRRKYRELLQDAVTHNKQREKDTTVGRPEEIDDVSQRYT